MGQMGQDLTVPVITPGLPPGPVWIPDLGVPPAPPPYVPWLEQSTIVFGAAIPNLALIAGGGLLVLAILRGGKKRR